MANYRYNKEGKGERSLNDALLVTKEYGLHLYEAHIKHKIAPATFKLWLGRYLTDDLVEIKVEKIGQRPRHIYFLTPQGEEYLHHRLGQRDSEDALESEAV